MTEEEKQTQIALGTYLPNLWKKYSKMWIILDQLGQRLSQIDGLIWKLTPEDNSKVTIQQEYLFTEKELLSNELDRIAIKIQQMYLNTVIETYKNLNLCINWQTGEIGKEN